MKYINCFFFLLVGISACQNPNSKKITLEDLQDSSNRTFPLDQQEQKTDKDITFYDTQQHIISPDKFNQLLAEGLYISVPQKQVTGTKELHLIHTLDHEKELEEQSLPAFVITDLAGRTYTLDNLKGKTTILSFWNIASKLCTQDISNLNPLAQKYQQKENVQWLGLVIDNANNLSKFLKLDHWHYTFAAEQEPLSKLFGVLTHPTHLIINEKGDIIKAIVRNSNSDEIIDHTLAKIVK